MDPRVTAPIERASTVAATEAQGTTTKPLDSARREATAASGTRSIVLAGDDFRAHRLLLALLRRPRSRTEAQSIAGASNLPDLVMRLRADGFDLPCARIRVEDRDGKVCHPGVYSASTADRTRIRRALRIEPPLSEPLEPTADLFAEGR